ncbi:hypothetical protein [Phosphitispora sp. TUW77]
MNDNSIGCLNILTSIAVAIQLAALQVEKADKAEVVLGLAR